MQGAQCDWCRRFAPSLPAGWYVLARIDAPAYHHGVAAVLAAAAAAGRPEPDGPLTFCTLLCLANWAWVKETAESAGNPGSEP